MGFTQNVEHFRYTIFVAGKQRSVEKAHKRANAERPKIQRTKFRFEIGNTIDFWT